MSSLLGNIRFYVLIFSFTLSVAIYLWVIQTTQNQTLQTIRLTQTYALTAATFLYFTLLAGPLTYQFRFLPFRVHYMKARRAIGVSTFYFALLHGRLAFFGELGGFPVLPILSLEYLLAITLGFSGLIILTLMAATANDFMVRKLTFARWKFLHRFIYLVGIFILIHALLIGGHFQDLGSAIPRISFAAIFFLLLLEARRIYSFLRQKRNV